MAGFTNEQGHGEFCFRATIQGPSASPGSVSSAPSPPSRLFHAGRTRALPTTTAPPCPVLPCSASLSPSPDTVRQLRLPSLVLALPNGGNARSQAGTVGGEIR